MSLDGQERKNVLPPAPLSADPRQGPGGLAALVRGSGAGYAMAALLVAIGVMAVMLIVAMPAWRQLVQREKEEELIFRGQQYARAIGLFQRRFGVMFPPNLDVLVEQRFLRKKYKDPMTSDGEFQLLYQGALAAAARPGQAAQRGPLAARGQGPAGQEGAERSSLPDPSASSSPQRSGQAGVGAGLGIGQGSPGRGPVGARGGIVGVASKSTARSIRLYNGRNFYNEWEFVYVALAAQPGVGPGLMAPGRARPPGQQQGPFPGGPGQRPGGPGPGGQRAEPRGPGGGPTGPRNPGGGPAGIRPPGD